MNRTHVRRVVAFALVTLIALAHVACTVGVGVGAPVYGGWGGYGAPYGGVLYGGGGPAWP
jgi:hypothetical protein